MLAPGTLHLTLTSQVGDGRDGGVKLAPRPLGVNNRLGGPIEGAHSIENHWQPFGPVRALASVRQS
jgi:hypothetical protein